MPARPNQNRVYPMRMARVNVTIPDDVLARARAAGLNVSRLSAAALSEELDRRAKVATLDAYLHALDLELGPVTLDEQAAAREWAEQALGDAERPRPSRPTQAA